MLAQPKLHLAVPCGHQSVCGACAERMLLCPYCRAPVQVWVQHRMVKTHTLELHCSVGLEIWNQFGSVSVNLFYRGSVRCSCC